MTLGAVGSAVTGNQAGWEAAKGAITSLPWALLISEGAHE